MTTPKSAAQVPEPMTDEQFANAMGDAHHLVEHLVVKEGALYFMARTACEAERRRTAAPAPPPDAELRAWLEREYARIDPGENMSHGDGWRYSLLDRTFDGPGGLRYERVDALVSLIRDAIVATGKRG